MSKQAPFSLWEDLPLFGPSLLTRRAAGSLCPGSARSKTLGYRVGL